MSTDVATTSATDGVRPAAPDGREGLTFLTRHVRTAGALQGLDPDFARATDELVGHPHRHGVLVPSLRALVVLACESVVPVADEARIARAVEAAIVDGATRDEILCALEIACSIGLHTVSVGLPILLEEMERAGIAVPVETSRQERMRLAFETSGPRPRPLNPIYAAILRMDPDYFAARVRFIDLPWEQAQVLDPEAKHLLSIAIDAVSPQHYADGLRKHVREALAMGVRPEAVLEVLELASVTGLRTLDVGLEVLDRTT